MATVRSSPQPATGADFKLFYAEEAVEATSPGGNWDQLPCNSFELVGDQTLTQDQVLSADQGRDGTEPYLDGVQTVKGNAKVPIDTLRFGIWLKLLFGTPVTTEANGLYTHVFSSGGADATMSSYSFEKAFPLISAFYHDVGVRADTLSVSMTPSGPAAATIGLYGLQEGAPANASIAGTPHVYALNRYMQSSGSILMNGTALAGVTAGTLNFSNNLKAAITIRPDNRAESLDYGQSTASGSVTLRFTNQEGIDALAQSVAPASLVYSMTSGAAVLTFTLAHCYFKPTGPAINTADAITREYSFIAANLADGLPLLSVSYVNTVTNY